MFEKQAEEYRKDLKSKFFLSEPQLDFACQGFKDGFNKANEWHYAKDGVFPNTENLECLCIIRPLQDDNEMLTNKDFRGVLYFRNGRFYLDEDSRNDCLKETNSDFTDLVIAWKEIVLPKRE